MAGVIGNVGDIHHIFPKAYLRKTIKNAPQRLYNQIANYTYLEKRINIAIGEMRPGEYFTKAREAVAAEDKYLGDIATEAELLLPISKRIVFRKEYSIWVRPITRASLLSAVSLWLEKYVATTRACSFD